MKNRWFGKILVSVLILSMVFCLAACGGKQGSEATESDGSLTVIVGSRDFGEQLILGEITMQVLENAGYKVEDQTNVAGSTVCRRALENGEFDVYWEYTGTAWSTFLGNTEADTDPQALYDALAKADADNGITWLDYAPMNNTYALVMTTERAEELGITSCSELGAYIEAHPGELILACTQEFTTGAAGLAGLSDAYGIDFGENIATMSMEMIFQTLTDGQADVGLTFATDGRIAKYDVQLLADDGNYFPVYNAAPCMRTDFADANPEIAKLLNPVAALLTNEAMQDLNCAVEVEGQEPAAVAAAWLSENGLISATE